MSSRVRAIRHGLLVWGGELTLARLSGEPQAWPDVLASLAAIGSLLALGAWLGERSGRTSQRVGGMMVRVPLALVAVGIVSPAAAQVWAKLLVAGAAAFWLARGSASAREGLDPTPGVWLTLGSLGAASLFSWGFESGMPPAWLPASVLAIWCGLAMLTARPAGRLAAALLVLVLVRVPGADVFAGDGGGASDRAEPTSPDLILITIDTLRADTASTMQSFQRLAARGIHFSTAQAAAPWTLPSMASLVTGLPVSAHGAGRADQGHFAGLPAEVPTLATRLAAAGYETVAVVAANPFVGPKFGFERGFSQFFHGSHERRFGLPRWPHALGYVVRPAVAHLLTRIGVMSRPPQGDAAALVDIALRQAARERSPPLFLWLHLLDPHLPYVHVARAPLEGPLRRRLISANSVREIRGDPSWASEEGMRALRIAYAQEVAEIDAALLRLLDELPPATSRGRVIVLTADHGEEFFDHDGFEHGHSFYQELLNVPLVIAGLSPESDIQADQPAGLVDIAPTLLRAAGVDAQGLPGRDLATPASDGSYRSSSLLYPENDADAASYAVRRGRWKAIVRGDRTELYDLERDPLERLDVADRHPELAKELAGAGPAASRRSDPVELDPEEVEALRALGYLPE